MKQTRKVTKIICDYCGKEFEKPLSEIKRNYELKRKNYCNLSCSGKININNIPLESRNHLENLKINNGDKYTGFREFLRRIKNRRKELKNTNLTLDYLLEIWNSQNGKCIYSKVDLILPKYNKKSNFIYTASLDRIDSNLGYIKGNVQFISIAMNHMKNKMSDKEVKLLCNILKEIK